MTRHGRLAIIVMVAALSAVTLLAGGATASAQDTSCYPDYHKASNGRYSVSYDHYDRGPEWKVSAYAPGTLTLSRSLGAANSYSGSFGLSPGDISATVGFDVTKSTTYTASYSYPMPNDPPNTRWTVEAGTRDDIYIYDVQKYNGCTGSPDGPVQRGRAEKTGHLLYKYYGQAPGRP